jgi:hypothetical protein
MYIEERIKAFSKLGDYLSRHMQELKSVNKNSWFTESNIEFAINETCRRLRYDSLEQWINFYPELRENSLSKNIGVITAGNIPLVGFHDFLSVLISGNVFVGKLSSKDDSLLQKVIQILVDIEPEFKKYIRLTTLLPKTIDAVIATGSNNTGRYFDYYFGKYPHIFRKNRNSAAILTGNENDKQLSGLADDMLLYFGLGCRSVSKLFLPIGYDLNSIFKASMKYHDLIKHHKYANNYDYNRVIYMMNKINFKENGFLILKEDISLASPISVVHYEFYDEMNVVLKRLEVEKSFLQCIVCEEKAYKKSVPFGASQKPELFEYADDIDTIRFLLNLKKHP